MKITKSQMRRVIKEWFSDEHDPATGKRDQYEPPGRVEEVWGDVEGALDMLTTALSKMEDLDPKAASDAAKYVAEEIHSWR